MKIFRVWYNISSMAYADIEAENVDDAMEKAVELDEEKFHEVEDREWSLDIDVTLEDNKEIVP